MSQPVPADPRLVAGVSALVLPGELSEGAPDFLERSVRAAAVARRWLELPALDDLAQLFEVDLSAVRNRLDADIDDAGWLGRNEVLPPWAPAALNGSLTVPAELEPATGLLRHVLTIERWAAEHLNFRGDDRYRERREGAHGNFSALEKETIRRCADELQLRLPTRPHYREYSSTLVLGAGWRSPLLRSKYAVLWQRAGVVLGDLHFLGSPRFLLAGEPDSEENPPEHTVTDEYAPGASDEFDLMVGAAVRQFAFAADPPRMLCGCASTDEVCPDWMYRGDAREGTPPQFTHERAVDLRNKSGSTAGTVLSASTSRPPDRPNTTDTLVLWARRAAPQPGARVLAVTTPLFVPFQTFDCLKELYLTRSVDADVIGYSYDWGDRPDTPEYQLQETLSGIRSARRLLVAALAPFIAGRLA